MPSAYIAAVVNAAQEMFACPLNKVCRLTGIQVTNITAVGQLTITDTFTPSVSNAVAVPVATDVIKRIIYIPNDATYEWADEMKSIKILGSCTVINSDANAKSVTVMWEQD